MKAPIDIVMDRVQWTPIKHEQQPDGLYATHEGTLTIEGYTLRCYILSDGQRVFHAEDVEKFFFA